MTSGILHPVIVLPSEAEAWSADDLERAIVHELEHVQRADWVTRCLARIACAIYWFHPLVWIAWRRFVLDAERSCDDAVLGRFEAASYADQLVGLAKRLSGAQRPTLLAMANRADLAARVGAVLDGNQKRGRVGKVTIALASTAAALLLALSPLKIVAAPPAPAPQAAAAQNVVVPAVAAPLIAFAPPQAVAAPTVSIPHYSSSTTMVVDTVTVSEQNGNAVAGLSPTDFVVTEDGKAQVIALFQPQPDGPSYLLGYYATPGDGSFRSTRVEVDRPSLVIRARAGYYTDKPGASVNNRAPGAPIPLSRPEAQYSEEARKAKWQGTVALDVLIDASGHVASASVSRPLGLGLDEKAIEAVKQWTFVPGTKNGQPVAAQAQIDVNFRLL